MSNDNNGRNLIKIKNGRFFYNELLILSTSDQNVYYKKAEKFFTDNNTLYIIFSPLIKEVDNAVKKFIPDTSYAVYIEHDEAISDFMNINTNTPISLPADTGLKYPYIHCKSVSNIKAIEQFFYYRKFRKIKTISMTGSQRLHKDFYKKCSKILDQRLATFWNNRFTEISLGYRWISNLLRNTLTLANSKNKIHNLSELKTSKPVAVCGAGDSLVTAAPFLRSNREQLFIIASDTASPALLAAGIKPDLITVLEAQQYNMLDFYGVLKEKIPIACDLTSYPSLIAETHSKTYLFASEFAHISIFNSLEQTGMLPAKIPPLGNIGILSLYIADMITDNQIFYCGIDFRNINGRPHCRGAYTHQKALNNCSRQTTTERYFASPTAQPETLGRHFPGSYIQHPDPAGSTANAQYFFNKPNFHPLTMFKDNYYVPDKSADEILKSAAGCSYDKSNNSCRNLTYTNDKCRELFNLLKDDCIQLLEQLSDTNNSEITPETFLKCSWLLFNNPAIPADPKSSSTIKKAGIYRILNLIEQLNAGLN